MHACCNTLTERRILGATVFPALVLLLFLREPSGAFLWATAALVVADFGVELLDVLCERSSRAALGGLPSAEYATHVFAITSRAAAFTLALVSRPPAAWILGDSSAHEAAVPKIARMLCWFLVAGGAAMAMVHLWLLRRNGAKLE